MALDPIVIDRQIRIDYARKMAEWQAAREINPGLMRAAMVINSTSAYEKMGWLGAVPAVRQWIGELNAKQLNDYDYTIRNLKWEASVPVEQDDLDDDQTGTIDMIPSLLVSRIMAHPEELMLSMVTGGTSGLAYDGVAFFSNASGARVIDNLLAGTGVTLAQLDADLNAALVAMASFVDDQGKVLNIRGDTILCPVALYNNFLRLVNSAGDPTVTGGNTYNPYQGKFTVIPDARLDAIDANDWYLLSTRDQVKPFIFSMRRAPRPMFEKKPGTELWLAAASYRGNAGYGLPHLAVKTVNS